MTAYCSRGLRRCPRWQADAALALLGHGFAELLHQRRVIVEKLQVPVDIRAVTKLGDREDARPVCAELGGVVWGDGEPVPEPLLLCDFLREVIAQEVAEEERFWYRFPVTPYNASQLSAYRSRVFAIAEFRNGSDVDRYLKLLDDYAALVEQLSETMAEQRKRGIRLPAWAAPEAAATVRGHAEASPALVVAPDRVIELGPGQAGRLADGVA